jgi:hypothetical protein
MAATELAETIYHLFIERGYRWKIGGIEQVPTPEDIDKTIDRAKKTLYAEPVPSQMELGRLIVRHWSPGKFDVYLHLGDRND